MRDTFIRFNVALVVRGFTMYSIRCFARIWLMCLASAYAPRKNYVDRLKLLPSFLSWFRVL